MWKKSNSVCLTCFRFICSQCLESCGADTPAGVSLPYCFAQKWVEELVQVRETIFRISHYLHVSVKYNVVEPQVILIKSGVTKEGVYYSASYSVWQSHRLINSIALHTQSLSKRCFVSFSFKHLSTKALQPHTNAVSFQLYSTFKMSRSGSCLILVFGSNKFLYSCSVSCKDCLSLCFLDMKKKKPQPTPVLWLHVVKQVSIKNDARNVSDLLFCLG